MNNFLNLTTTKLGTAAEMMLINEFILSKGYSPMTPSAEGSHKIDSCAMSWSGVSWYMDVKCKSRRIHYSDTGFDYNDYQKYMSFDKPTYILFADVVQKKVYGNWLQKLTGKIQGNIIYFPLEQMVDYRDLSEIEYATLKEYERSNYYKK